MAGLTVDSDKTEAKKEVQVSVTSVKEDEKDKAEAGKPGPSRILRYAEVWVSFVHDMCYRSLGSY